MHSRPDVPPLSSLHRWTLHKNENESLAPISPVMAGRFREEWGILRHGLEDQRGAEILWSWGYGILEEF